MNSASHESNFELFLENKRDALLRMIVGLEERLSGISFDEEGNIIGDLDKKLSDIEFDQEGNIIGNIENSVYFSNANRSADDLRLIILNSGIEKQKLEIKKLEEKQKKEKQFLQEQKKALKDSEAEIYRLDVEILTSNRNDPKSYVENTNALVDQRAKKEELIKLIGRLESDFKTSTIALKISKEAAQSIIKEFDSVKAKTVKDYIDFKRLKRDLTELSDAKRVIEKLDKAKQAFKSEELEIEKQGKTIEPVAEQTKAESENKPKEESVPGVQKEATGVIHLGPIPDSSEPTTLIVLPPRTEGEEKDSSTIEPEKPGDAIPEKPPESVPEKPITKDNREWKMDGFTLDFIEKFKYIPGKFEREANANYNGDYNSLRSNYAKTEAPDASRENIVVRIRNCVRNFANNIRNREPKTFVPRVAVEMDAPKLLE